jgi:uncharacterized glyoxalase superfamily protein PhnB
VGASRLWGLAGLRDPSREAERQDYGGGDYTCKDPEGNVWTFGTYDPWAGH